MRLLRWARSPVTQFLLAGLVTLVLVVVATGRLSRQAATDEAVAGSRATTEVLGRSVAQPLIPPGLVQGRPGAVDRFDRAARHRLLVGSVRRVKIWTARGRIVYSDKTQLIGSSYALGRDELAVLRTGRSDAAVSDLGRPENRFERGLGGLLEVYTRIESPEGRPLLFEAYYSDAEVAARGERIFDAFRPITLIGLLVLSAVATPLLLR